MASGTISLGQSGSIIGQIVWSSSSNGTSANSSQVTAIIQCKKSANTTQPTTGTWTGNLNIGGENQAISERFTIGTSWVTLKTFTITKAHNSDGTGTCYIQGSITGPAGTSQAGKTVSGSETVTLDKIDRYATITSAPNFNDEQNPKIEFYNPAGFTLQLKIEAGGNANLIKRDNITAGSPYTFQLTEAERNLLRALTPNSNTLSVRFTVGTYINGTVQSWSYLDRTMTIINANPTYNSAYLDTNLTTTAITNDNQKIIQNNSTLQINITNAQAKKYATLDRAVISLNGNTYTANFSGNNSVSINVGTVNISSNIGAEISVYDSRGNVQTTTKQITILGWELPSAQIKCYRVSNYYTQTNLKVDANYSSLDSNNSITIQYQIKKITDSTYGNLVTINNNEQVQFNADNQYKWNVKVIITDLLGAVTYNLLLPIGTPITYFDTSKNSVGINCLPAGTGTFEIAYKNNQPSNWCAYRGDNTDESGRNLPITGNQWSIIDILSDSMSLSPEGSVGLYFDENDNCTGFIINKSGKYRITMNCRWADVTSNNNCCLALSVNGSTQPFQQDDIDQSVWQTNTFRLTTNAVFICDFEQGQVIKPLVFSEITTSISNIAINIERLCILNL